MKKVFLISLTLGVLITLNAQDEREGAGGVVFGEGYAFAVGAPPGWIFDTQSALAIGARVVIYPAEGSLEDAAAWITANAFPLDGLSLDEWVKNDNDGFIAEFEGIELNELEDLATSDSARAITREFLPGTSEYQLSERIAYIKLDDFVAVIALSAPDSADYTESLQAFTYVVEGLSNFKNMLDKVAPE